MRRNIAERSDGKDEMILTQTEEQILTEIRSLRPMETIIIRADAQGRAEKFYIKRTEAFFLVSGNKKSVADKLGLQLN
jgi:hypothetical protein